jgi:hypothetical protein
MVNPSKKLDPAEALRAALHARCGNGTPESVERADERFARSLRDYGIVRFRLLTLTVPETPNGAETHSR